MSLGTEESTSSTSPVGMDLSMYSVSPVSLKGDSSSRVRQSEGHKVLVCLFETITFVEYTSRRYYFVFYGESGLTSRIV